MSDSDAPGGREGPGIKNNSDADRDAALDTAAHAKAKVDIDIDIDFEEVFQALPSPVLLLAPDLVIVAANRAYAQVSGRGPEELVGRFLFDVFPDSPSEEATGARTLRASLERVLETGERDTMALQKYDVEEPGRPGVFRERYWSPVNIPVLDAEGRVSLIAQRVEEVTALVRARQAAATTTPGTPHTQHTSPTNPTTLTTLSQEDAMTADLLTRSQELQELNEELRKAHARTHEVAVTLQRAMLPGTALPRHDFAAVRYRPAVSFLNVCGDWYDLIDLDADRLAAAVGDVVGHGLEAAGVMGQLRSALSAAIRATGRPADALRTLAQHAHTVEGALATTAVQAVIDRAAHTITYSCAGHPPPLLAHADGTVVLLDTATDPPLAACDDSVPRNQATASYAPGATLVLYTDGLIERRGEDIDQGLHRLIHSLTRHHTLSPEPLADAILSDLVPAPRRGPDDDTALVVIRL
ncbi:PP2C family protein-serine/threonine phosphatase [Streptomyces sp. NBC_00878]|uniref:PP2C family protein-serine/threonine phosphatase n=1 Tax=Streptomyces sp. NBC_00878 TaxID=2975854 RepID=UPI00225C037D|nr:SpoIIE family protein phosphatase [Streptomyces sp. NBC_00878]MCX4907335.1 SpoIIE family protein phosphatase [Streptomyces sp. NBC_00878]